MCSHPFCLGRIKETKVLIIFAFCSNKILLYIYKPVNIFKLNYIINIGNNKGIKVYLKPNVYRFITNKVIKYLIEKFRKNGVRTLWI